MPLLNWVVTVVEFAVAGIVVIVVGTSTTCVAGCTVVYSRVVVVSLVITAGVYAGVVSAVSAQPSKPIAAALINPAEAWPVRT